MEIERKIYSSYAFEKDEVEKSKINASIYNELVEKYKVAMSGSYAAKGHESEYDILYSSNPKYGHTVYTVDKNTTHLTDEELALIFDGGSLCFGFTKEYNGSFSVFTD